MEQIEDNLKKDVENPKKNTSEKEDNEVTLNPDTVVLIKYKKDKK